MTVIDSLHRLFFSLVIFSELVFVKTDKASLIAPYFYYWWQHSIVCFIKLEMEWHHWISRLSVLWFAYSWHISAIILLLFIFEGQVDITIRNLRQVKQIIIALFRGYWLISSSSFFFLFTCHLISYYINWIYSYFSGSN